MHIPWYIVSGFGAHLKATPRVLVVQKNGKVEEIPLSAVRHLLVMGGHSLHTSVFTRLLSEGSCISFFEADGEPLGILRPFGDRSDEVVREAQTGAFAHSYALAIAKGAGIARILSVAKLQEECGEKLLYEGELELLEKSQAELEFLIRVEEIRRIHRLVSDMYYEILSRTFPPELGFRRRTPRPHQDVVNAMLSYGYGMLFGNTCVSAIGAHLDPDHGFLHRGRRGLVYDLIDPFKPAMIDRTVLTLAREELSPYEYECDPVRCTLSDELIKKLTERFRRSLKQEVIDAQVMNLKNSLMKKTDFCIINPEDSFLYSHH